jgi:hypothetical protein
MRLMQKVFGRQQPGRNAIAVHQALHIDESTGRTRPSARVIADVSRRTELAPVRSIPR